MLSVTITTQQWNIIFAVVIAGAVAIALSYWGRPKK